MDKTVHTVAEVQKLLGIGRACLWGGKKPGEG